MPEPPKQPVDIPFPISGIVEGSSHTQQPLNTTWDAKNVVPFDPEEDRARGGRRNGIEKVTGTPVTSDRVQMIRSVGIVPGDANAMVGGAVSKFSDDVDSAHKFGNVPYQGLADGTPVTSSVLGHKFYGYCNQHFTLTDNGVHVDNETDPVNTSAEGGSAPLYRGTTFGTKSIDAWNDSFGAAHTGFTKKTDNNGSPYLSIDPCRFPIQGNGLIHEPFQFWYDNAKTNEWRKMGNSKKLEHKSLLTLIPEMHHEETPWNSSPEKEFVAKVEFTLPKGHVMDIGGDRVVSGTGDKVRFTETEADATEQDEFYDPYFHQCMTYDSGTFPTDEDATTQWFGDHRTGSHHIGFIFRNNLDLSDPNSDNASWSIATGTEDLPFFVGIETFNCGTRALLKIMGLKSGIYSDVLESKSGHKYITPALWNNTDPSDDSPGIDLDKYHTLEIRLKGNRLDIAFNGVSKLVIEDITLDDDFGSRIAKDEATDTATTYGHSMFVYAQDERWDYYGQNASQGTNFRVTAGESKRLAGYYATRDFTTRKGTGDKTAKEIYESSTEKSGDRTEEIRIRSIEWLEMGSLMSVPQNTIAVSGGHVYGSPGQNEFNRISSTQDLNSNQNMINAVEYFQKMYFVDGDNYKVYDPAVSAVQGAAGSISDWNAVNGELPGGDGKNGANGSDTSDGNARCPIIATWLGRIVLAGKADDSQNWFMSAVGDPLDWDYLTGSDETGAVKGSSTRQFGEMASAITALIPFSGTKLLIGGISSMHMLTGDPLWADTQQHALSWDVGIVGPEAWCYGPGNSVYFMGENGLYVLMPNDYDISQTDRLSAGKFDKTFAGVNFDSASTMLAYDHEKHGVHIFVTPSNQQVSAVGHYYYDRRSDSFWNMEYPAVVGPTAVYDFKSQSPGARRILLGGFDGHIRSFSETAKTDDGTAIDSYVWLGPIQTTSTREAKLTNLIAVLDRESADVNYSIHVADSVEEAKQSEAVHSSTWSSGRNGAHRMRARGSAIFIKLYNNSSNLPWVYERLTAMLAVAGKVRDR
tara:strand:+ start:3655 stop:6747 length:3093 start_codon:yes stop_codon:yes gene_type:complete